MKTPGIDQDTLAHIIDALGQSATVEQLRQNFPHLHFTACSDDDIPARIEPIAQAPGYYLYGITHAGGHCITFTSELASATGLVVAQIDDED